MISPHKIAEVCENLEDRTDGPATEFVIIARACDLAASGSHDPETIANALFESLQGFCEPQASLERC